MTNQGPTATLLAVTQLLLLHVVLSLICFKIIISICNLSTFNMIPNILNINVLEPFFSLESASGISYHLFYNLK